MHFIDIHPLISLKSKNLSTNHETPFFRQGIVPAVNQIPHFLFLLNYKLTLKGITYASALIVDLLSQRTCEFLFEKNADIINSTNSGPYFYYAYFEQEGKVSFHQFNFLNFSDKEFIVLKKHSTSSLGDVRLLGLDDRHVFVFDPGPQPDISCFYQVKLLVNVLNGQTHPVPDRLGNDFFSRLQEAWLLDGGKFLTVKTGRIQWWEKKEFWQQDVTHYTDRIETLALCRTDDLIRCIQAGQDIPWTIIDQSDYSSALRMLGDHDQYLYYSKQDFQSGYTTIYKYSLYPSPHRADILYQFKEEFEQVFFHSNEGYGIRWTDEKRNELELVRLNGMCPLFRTQGRIIHTDGKFVLTAEPTNPKSEKPLLLLYDISKKSVIRQIHDRSVFYDRYGDQMILY